MINHLRDVQRSDPDQSNLCFRSVLCDFTACIRFEDLRPPTGPDQEGFVCFSTHLRLLCNSIRICMNGSVWDSPARRWCLSCSPGSPLWFQTTGALDRESSWTPQNPPARLLKTRNRVTYWWSATCVKKKKVIKLQMST